MNICRAVCPACDIARLPHPYSVSSAALIRRWPDPSRAAKRREACRVFGLATCCRPHGCEQRQWVCRLQGCDFSNAEERETQV